MASVHDQIRNHALAACGYLEPIPVGRLDVLRKSEWSPEFERLLRNKRWFQWHGEFERHMRNALIMGALRYGKLNAPGKPHWDRVSAIEYRWGEYWRTKNKMFLVDIANFCLLEFEEGGGKLEAYLSAREVLWLAKDYRLTKNKYLLIDIAQICIELFETGPGEFTPTEDTKKVEAQ